MRKLIIGANWKMNKTPQEGVELVKALKESLGNWNDVEIVVCPPYPALTAVQEVLEEEGNLILGAQNLYWEEAGAFTGEVAPAMLTACGCQYVLIGHSERRHVFGETDAEVAKKVRAALDAGLRPIVCVGELLEQWESGQTEQVVKEQLEVGLGKVEQAEAATIVVAYEPVWAIGTGKASTAEDAEGMAAFIRGVLENLFGEETAQAIRIQYGGSVKPENVAGYLGQPNIDGALVGGASLKADVFTELVKNSREG